MSKKIAVIYKTKYGSTKKYAGWIALKLYADLYEISDIRSKHLDEYETIIFGGGIYRGKINGLNFIDQNYNKIKDKNIYIFSVGMESISENRKESLIKNNILIFLSAWSRPQNTFTLFSYKYGALKPNDSIPAFTSGQLVNKFHNKLDR